VAMLLLTRGHLLERNGRYTYQVMMRAPIMTRDMRGKRLVQEGKVERTGRHTWKVTSSDGSRQYRVTDWQDADNRFECECYDFRRNKAKCKHVAAIHFLLLKDEFGIDLIGGDQE